MEKEKKFGLKFIILSIIGFSIIFSSIIFQKYIDKIINFQLHKNLMISPGSKAYNFWMNPPAQIIRKFYFFDIKNPKQVEKGSKPILIQRGPFVYKEKWEKRNVEFLNDNLVKYTPVTYLEFSPELSNGTEDDQITFLNIPAIIYTEMAIKGKIPETILNFLFQYAETQLFIKKTIRELIYGYDDPLMKLAHTLVPNIVFHKKFSVLKDENGSQYTNYTMMTGIDNMNNVGKLVQWNQYKKLDHWYNKYANMINGSDGTFFQPFLTKNQTLYVFNPNMCRSFHLVFLKENIYKNTKVYDFHLPKNIFANTTNNPDNVGFCGESCLGNGVLNISTCYHGAPGFISQPHFLNADQKFIDSVRGLNPNENIHDLVLHFEPLTGVPLSGNIRLQINFLLKRNKNIDLIKNLNQILLPVFWFDSDIEMNDDITKQLSSIAFYLFLVKVLFWIILIFGAVLSIFSLIFFTYKFLNYRNVAKYNILKVLSIPQSV